MPSGSRAAPPPSSNGANSNSPSTRRTSWPTSRTCPRSATGHSRTGPSPADPPTAVGSRSGDVDDAVVEARPGMSAQIVRDPQHRGVARQYLTDQLRDAAGAGLSSEVLEQQ